MEKEWWELARSIIIEDSSDPDDLVEAVKSLERKTKKEGHKINLLQTN